MDTSAPATPLPGGDDIEKILADAQAGGKLKPLEDIIEEQGYSMTADELLKAAQLDDRTYGKSPQELADMLRADSSLYDDLEATKPGGALAKEPAEAEPAEEDEVVSGMEKHLGESETMKEGDVKKAVGAMRKTGARKPDKMNFGQKAKFMSEMNTD